MHRKLPKVLSEGDQIKVIAPSFSMRLISPETREYARQNIEDVLGLRLSYGSHVEEADQFGTSDIGSRVEDLHEAFEDDSVRAIITCIGGLSSNQLLEHIDWPTIGSNPKAFCGFSDITVLSNAIFAKTGLVTFSGPHYSSLGQKHLDPYNLDYLKKALFSARDYEIAPSSQWTDDEYWFQDQNNRNPMANEGPWAIRPGSATGTIIGGNLTSLNLLQGTEYFPDVENPVLFIEDTEDARYFDRDLQSLLQTMQGIRIGAVVIGRFPKAAAVSRSELTNLIEDKRALDGTPVVANVDFGHTFPIATFPIGGTAEIMTGENRRSIITVGNGNRLDYTAA